MLSVVPKMECRRLLELYELDFDYSVLDEEFSGLTEAATRLTGAEICLVNLIDTATQWSVSRRGAEMTQMKREDSVCQYVIEQDDIYEIPDLTQDARFRDKFYVVGGPHLKYYLGVPLKMPSGANIGALCILNSETLNVGPEVRSLLLLLAQQAVRHVQALARISRMEHLAKDMKMSMRMLSHDVRSPVSAIISLSDLIKEDLEGERLDSAREMTDIIQSSSEEVLELTDRVLRRKDDDEALPDFEMDCQVLAKKLQELYLPQAVAKGCHLEFSVRDPSRTCFPRARIFQIAGNLLANSIKFSEEQGAVVHVEVRFDRPLDPREQGVLTVVIADQGVGMTQERINEILSGTVSFSEEGTLGERGYGYGLSLVQYLVTQARGTMEIESEIGVGSRFTVRLPM